MGEDSIDCISVETKEPSFLRRWVELDTKVSLQIHTFFQPVPRSVLKTLEICGDGRFWFPVPFALFFYSSSSDLRRFLVYLFLGFVLDILLVGILKYLIRRPRPVYNKGMHLTISVDHWSFPSGHSSRVFFICCFMYLHFLSFGEEFLPLGSVVEEFVRRWTHFDGKIVQLFLLVVFVWSIVTSISRVLLGRHFVFDVLAGACLGFLEALVVHYLSGLHIGSK